ncbi:concanavalin A-like lectin/glucanase domain-containing protein [Mycena pura]|uniref:Concanavalin A-like lectin/glucanase domain-containing protein n=1 Tax=Mycena pura TaxID=153505 RepID=A0AAD6UVW1_9AGAR|nr:concanavalin A-like lectin/glucanase domain-containing protein [Mycena pura]
MFTFAKLSVLCLLIPFISASPVEERAAIDTTSHCGQWDTVVAGPYTLFLDQWGLSGATSGSDCASLTSLNGNTLAWQTTWTWVGGTGVKSFTNINANNGINQQLSAIKSIPAVWTWSQSSTSVVADVAYDMFTSTSPGGSAVNEIMIWLANFNAGPISATFNSAGQPVPVASSVSLGGHSWNLYFGSNGANNVYSFLPTSGTVPSFNSDIMLFLNYLITNQGLSSSQFLTTLQGGTEATSGSATLTSSAFSLVINGAAATTTPPAGTSTSTTPPSSTGGTAAHFDQCGGQNWAGPTVCAAPFTCQVQNPFFSQCL